MSNEEKTFFDNVQGILNKYLICKFEWKNTERAKHSIQIAMNQFWIGRTIEEKQNEFLDKQIEILEKIYSCFLENHKQGKKLFSEECKTLTRKYINWFREFILD